MHRPCQGTARGLILPRRWTFWITGFGIVIPITLAALTYFHLLPSFSILKKEPLIISDISVAIPYGVVFASTLALTAYFVTYLVDRLREKHEEIRRLYLFSEKLRSSIIMDKVMETIREEIAVLCGNSRVVYLSLDKDRLQLGSKTQQDSAESLDIPVNDRNAFWATLISGEVHIIESAALKSSYEEAVFAGLMPGAQKIVILPAQASLWLLVVASVIIHDLMDNLGKGFKLIGFLDKPVATVLQDLPDLAV